MDPRADRKYLLLCDYCASGAIHCGCANPKYSSVPEGNFACPKCIIKVMVEHRDDYMQLMDEDVPILDLTEPDLKIPNRTKPKHSAKMLNYSINDIITLMFVIRDNSSFSNGELQSIRGRLEREHTIPSLKQKILAVCACLKYEVAHDDRLDDLKIKHKEYNPDLYKKYTTGTMNIALGIFLNLTVYQEDIGRETAEAVNTTLFDSFFRNCVYNRHSREYIENKRFQCAHIDRRMRNTKLKMFDETKHSEIDMFNQSDVEKAFNTINAALRLHVLQFFNYKKEDKKCVLCHHKKIERCHLTDCKSLFLDMVSERKLIGCRINVGTLHKYFILQHKKEPLWMLCKRCHRYWDKIYKPKHAPVGQQDEKSRKRNLNRSNVDQHSNQISPQPKKKRKIDIIVLD